MQHAKKKTQHYQVIDASTNPRPKSRVFPASKRQSKVRYSTRPTSYLSAWPHHYDSNDTWNDTSGDLTSGPAPPSTQNISANTSRQLYSSDDYAPYPAPDKNYSIAQSDCSLDLDTFPIPPLRTGRHPVSGHVNSSTRDTKESLNDSTSAVIRSLARAYISTAKVREGSPRKSMTSYTSRHQYVDGAHDSYSSSHHSYSSSHHSSVDSALVDAISRNVMQQFKLIAMDKRAVERQSHGQKKSNAPADRHNN